MELPSTQNSVTEVLVERLMTIHRVQASFLKIMGEQPKRFRRGDIQRVICSDVGIPFIGLNKRLINEALVEMGYVKITVDGIRYYRKG